MIKVLYLVLKLNLYNSPILIIIQSSPILSYHYNINYYNIIILYQKQLAIIQHRHDMTKMYAHVILVLFHATNLIQPVETGQLLKSDNQ